MTTGMKATTFQQATDVLSEAIPNYEARPEQARLAVAIEDALTERRTLVGQGGCGVGKSFASLVPAILSGRRTVYSTATKALQEQIASKDLPFLAEHFPTTYAILKGRSNYLCLAKLAEADAEVDATFRSAVESANLGERDELPAVNDATWAKLTISSEECPGKKQCPFGEVCFAEKAKQAAQAAQVVVVNHALLAIDAVVRDISDGQASMIGEYDALIVDEAHEFEDYVSSALAATFRASSVLSFATELRNFSKRIRLDADDKATALSAAANELFGWLPLGRLRQSAILESVALFEALIAAYAGAIEWLNDESVIDAVSAASTNESRALRVTRDRLRRRAQNAVVKFQSALLDSDADTVRYVEEVTRGQVTHKAIVITPVTVSEWLRESMWSRVRPILISATILVGGKADFIANRLGLENFTTVDAGSPFDYKRQARLYVPRNLPVPSGATTQAWSVQAIEEMHRLVKASDGRALLLFTSRSEMMKAWDALVNSGRFDRWPCRKQGDESNQSLMSWFKADRHSVLFALKSFFTGIDIQGDALGLVVINKLPFPVPTEPVFEARSEAIKRRGGNDFSELTIPSMTLPLQQAAGRLIRTKTDGGVVAILDPRLVTKQYGATIMRSLPDMPVIHSHAEVQDFFAGLQNVVA